MRAERPPEEWLLKAHDGDVLVDLIYRPSGGPIDSEFFARAEELEVLGHSLLVASIDDVFVSKLLALTEQEPDFQSVLELARALRETDRLGERALAYARLAFRARVLHPRRRAWDRRPGEACSRASRALRTRVSDSASRVFADFDERRMHA